MKMLWTHRDAVYLSQAAGKFEMEESSSAVMFKPDPTGEGSLINVHIEFCLIWTFSPDTLCGFGITILQVTWQAWLALRFTSARRFKETPKPPTTK